MSVCGVGTESFVLNFEGIKSPGDMSAVVRCKTSVAQGRELLSQDRSLREVYEEAYRWA